MADEKILKDEILKDELLTDDELDNVAGGAPEISEEEYKKQLGALGDERDDVEQANMSAAFINGDITGGEDF